MNPKPTVPVIGRCEVAKQSRQVQQGYFVLEDPTTENLWTDARLISADARGREELVGIVEQYQWFEVQPLERSLYTRADDGLSVKVTYSPLEKKEDESLLDLLRTNVGRNL